MSLQQDDARLQRKQHGCAGWRASKSTENLRAHVRAKKRKRIEVQLIT